MFVCLQLLYVLLDEVHFNGLIFGGRDALEKIVQQVQHISKAVTENPTQTTQDIYGTQ